MGLAEIPTRFSNVLMLAWPNQQQKAHVVESSLRLRTNRGVIDPLPHGTGRGLGQQCVCETVGLLQIWRQTVGEGTRKQRKEQATLQPFTRCLASEGFLPPISAFDSPV